jgi:hypothetical protein
VHLAAVYNVFDDEGRLLNADLSQAVSMGCIYWLVSGSSCPQLTAGHTQQEHRHVVQCAHRLRRARYQPGSASVQR